MTKRAWILFGIVLVLLQIADGALTWHALDLELANEGNSIAVKLIRVHDLIPALLILKATGIALIFILFGVFYYINRINISPVVSRFAKITIGVCVIVTGHDVIDWLIFILKQAAFL